MEAGRRIKRHYAKKKPKEPKPAFQPKMLKGGYWQEGNDEDDIDIFEWFSSEDFNVQGPAAVSERRELAAYTYSETIGHTRYTVPEYRAPPKKVQLQKGLKRPAPVDQGNDHVFTADVARALARYRSPDVTPESAAEVLAAADVVTSIDALRMLVAFLDETLSDDMRAKGLNLARRREAELIDLMRVTHMPEAPNAVVLGTVWNWSPRHAKAMGLAINNENSYDGSWERAVTGGETHTGGPRGSREKPVDYHYRLLSYDIGGLKVVVRARTVATVPAAEVDAFEHIGQAVELETANYRKAGNLWNRTLPSYFALMQLSDVGMVVRGILDKGFLVELQEVTQEDLRLDRPDIDFETGVLLGRLCEMLRRIHEISNCPGCKDRPVYLQYCNYELRLVAPIFDDDDEGYDDKDSDDEDESTDDDDELVMSGGRQRDSRGA